MAICPTANSLSLHTCVATRASPIGAAGGDPIATYLAIKFIKNRPEVEKAVLEWALNGRAKIMTTSAGDPRRHIARIKGAGVIVYHQVASLDGALKAEDAGVDGLIAEGGESGGVRVPDSLHSFALLHAGRERISLPIVAAGGNNRLAVSSSTSIGNSWRKLARRWRTSRSIRPRRSAVSRPLSASMGQSWGATAPASVTRSSSAMIPAVCSSSKHQASATELSTTKLIADLH